MKYMYILLLLFFVGCDTSTNTNNSSDNSTSSSKMFRINGELSVMSSGKPLGGAIQAKVCLKGKEVCTTPSASGKYELTGPLGNQGSVSFRASVDSTPVDTVEIRDNYNHVIREIPLYSWATTLPTNYLVQRNLYGKILREYSNKLTYEAVYWNDKDSIAYVIPLEANRIANSYSGFVYMMYDDTSFFHGTKNRNVFSRVRDSNKIVGKTEVVSFSERSGDIDFGVVYPTPFIRDTNDITYIPDNHDIRDFDTAFSINSVIFKDSIGGRRFTNKAIFVVDSGVNWLRFRIPLDVTVGELFYQWMTYSKIDTSGNLYLYRDSGIFIPTNISSLTVEYFDNGVVYKDFGISNRSTDFLTSISNKKVMNIFWYVYFDNRTNQVIYGPSNFEIKLRESRFK